MPRRARSAIGGLVYHVLNRANARATLFEDNADYAAFEKVLTETHKREPVPILAYCIMPNYWHLVLYPSQDGQLSEFMRWLTVTHSQRWHAHHHTSGTGHLYQGRFKSFPVQTDEHFLTVCRYVERNALRANLVRRAENWRWSSLWRRRKGNEEARAFLSPWPVDAPSSARWLETVNRPQSTEELEGLRRSVARNRPFGTEAWQKRTARRLGLESALRPIGRPRTRRQPKP